jgi:hypothetical protein
MHLLRNQESVSEAKSSKLSGSSTITSLGSNNNPQKEYLIMARVIGIPLSKGNEDVVIAVEILEADLPDMFEGRAVAVVDGSPVSGELVVGKDLTSGFYGFIMDINPCSRMASVVRSAGSVYLPQGDNLLASGDAVTVDAATGLISSVGAVVTNGVVVQPNVTEIVNGKTGEKLPAPYGVCIRIAGARQVS